MRYALKKRFKNTEITAHKHFICKKQFVYIRHFVCLHSKIVCLHWWPSLFTFFKKSEWIFKKCSKRIFEKGQFWHLISKGLYTRLEVAPIKETMNRDFWTPFASLELLLIPRNFYPLKENCLWNREGDHTAPFASSS